MPKTQQKHSAALYIRYLVGISALVMLMFGFVVTDSWKKNENQALRDGENNSARLVRILSEHVEVTLHNVDLALRRTLERQYFTAISGKNFSKYTQENFKSWVNEMPQVVAMAVINEDGTVDAEAEKAGYDNWLSYNKKIIAQRFLDSLRNADASDVFIGRQELKAGKSIIIMSRRFNKTNGDFGGVVVAAIDPEYFVDFYNSIAEGTHKFMAIMLLKGVVLSSSPYNSAVNEAIGKDFLSRQEKTPNMLYQKNFVVSDTTKIVSLKVLPNNMPIAVQVVLDQEDFLADWQRMKMKDFGFLILFIVFSSILAFFAIAMARQVVKVQESENKAILASQAKSEFLANMSHELRTPLNAIIGFSEMLNSSYFGEVNEKQKERIHDINLCGSHLLQLINDILEFSKGNAGKLELVEEKVDIRELVDESVRIMQGRIKTKNINLVVDVAANLPYLWGDKRKVRQVLINLLSNSFKFTPEHGRISVSASVDKANNLILAVADSGIGIAEADIPKALSVFGQVHRAQSHEGTGLGLPLCKMYAELHDGKLLLTSKQNEGTTVKIIFPFQRSLPNNDYAVPAAVPASPAQSDSYDYY